MTGSGDNGWLMIDMGASYEVSGVVIFNRVGHHASRPVSLQTHDVKIGDAFSDPLQATTSCTFTAADATNSPSIALLDEACSGTGRYVYIQVDDVAQDVHAAGIAPSTGKELALREVYVYGPTYATSNWVRLEDGAGDAILPTAEGDAVSDATGSFVSGGGAHCATGPSGDSRCSIPGCMAACEATPVSPTDSSSAMARSLSRLSTRPLFQK